jgi:hypothetical protein
VSTPGRSVYMSLADFPATWAEAANVADFPFYELEAPRPDARWAGGYGWNHRRHARERHGTRELEILFLVAGREISVSTLIESPMHRQPEWAIRHLLDQLLTVSLHSEDFLLPVTWTAEAQDRTMAIDGVSVPFSGIVLNGTWAGWAELASGVALKVMTPAEQVLTSLRRCLDWSMGEVGPEVG